MAKKKAKAKCPSKGSTKTIGGKRFSLKQRSTSKSAAKKAAKAHRAKGKNKNARVVKDGCGYAVYTRG